MKILGFHPIHARPESLIIQNLLIAPPHVRPSVEMDAISKAEEDITVLY